MRVMGMMRVELTDVVMVIYRDEGSSVEDASVCYMVREDSIAGRHGDGLVAVMIQ